MSLSDAITNALREQGLTLSAAARLSGVSLPTLRRAIKGGSPYSSTIPGLAKLLRKSASDVRALINCEPKGSPAPVQGHRATIANALAMLDEAQRVLKDPLACQVHALSKKHRAIVAAIVESLPK